jgi:hypothetical protein
LSEEANTAWKFIPMHAAQDACVNSTVTYRGFVGGRGAGKSFTGAYDLLRRARTGRLYLVGNPTYPNLRDTTLRTFKSLARKFGRLTGIKEGAQPAATILAGDGRGVAEVLFRSTKEPETLRGPNLSGVWLDEASLMARTAFEIVIACLREGGESGWLLATYTPKGRGSWTYRQFQTGAPDSVFFHSKTIENPFAPSDFEARLRRQYSRRLIAQELEAESLDDGDAAIRFEDVLACQIEPADCVWPNGSPPQPLAGRPREFHELYLGVDVGRTRDRTVLWTWERVGDVLWCRECLVLRDAPFAQQEDAIVRRVRGGYYCRAYVDQGAIGAGLTERLAAQFPSLVQGVTLSGGIQGKLADQMRTAFEQRAVRIPDDPDLRNDFQLVSTPRVIDGRSVLRTDRDETGHADRFWAAALALDAALHYRPVRTARPRFGPPR